MPSLRELEGVQSFAFAERARIPDVGRSMEVGYAEFVGQNIFEQVGIGDG